MLAMTHNLEGLWVIVCCTPSFVHQALLLQILALGVMNMSVTSLQNLEKSTQLERVIPWSNRREKIIQLNWMSNYQELLKICGLAKQCARFFPDHNAEPDAVDLLEELEIIDEITCLVDENTYGCVCRYMMRYVIFYIIFLHDAYYLLDV